MNYNLVVHAVTTKPQPQCKVTGGLLADVLLSVAQRRAARTKHKLAPYLCQIAGVLGNFLAGLPPSSLAFVQVHSFLLGALALTHGQAVAAAFAVLSCFTCSGHNIGQFLKTDRRIMHCMSR